MPRQSRIDAPRALHHLIFRGIERRKIFMDNVDRARFVGRLGKLGKRRITGEVEGME